MSDEKPRRTTVSELAKMLVEGRRVAATPHVMVKMVKPGELQFEVETVPDVPDDVIDGMTEQVLRQAARIMRESANGAK